MHPGDQFIYQQIGAYLAAEPAVYTAYLPTAGGHNLLAGLTRKAYWAALTATHIYLIQTPLGAFKPLYENKGVRTIERTSITGAHLGGNVLTIALVSGERLAFQVDRQPKFASGQAHFYDELATRHGSTGAAVKLGKRMRLKTIAGIVAGVAVTGFYLYQTQHGGRAEVSVNCNPVDDKIVCTVSHDAGGADANVCWDVKLSCGNGKKPIAHACTDVARKSSSTVELTEAQFSGIDKCEPPVQQRLANLKVIAD